MPVPDREAAQEARRARFLIRFALWLGLALAVGFGLTSIPTARAGGCDTVPHLDAATPKRDPSARFSVYPGYFVTRRLEGDLPDKQRPHIFLSIGMPEYRLVWEEPIYGQLIDPVRGITTTVEVGCEMRDLVVRDQVKTVEEAFVQMTFTGVLWHSDGNAGPRRLYPDAWTQYTLHLGARLGAPNSGRPITVYDANPRLNHTTATTPPTRYELTRRECRTRPVRAWYASDVSIACPNVHFDDPGQYEIQASFTTVGICANKTTGLCSDGVGDGYLVHPRDAGTRPYLLSDVRRLVSEQFGQDHVFNVYYVEVSLQP